MNSKITKNLLIVLAAFGIVFGVQKLQAADGIDVKQAASMVQQGMFLLDVREPEEYAEVHAPNATLIPLGQLSSRLSELNAYKDKPIAVMCRSGRRSAKAVQILQEAGFSKVRNISGGVTSWESAGLTVVRQK